MRIAFYTQGEYEGAEEILRKFMECSPAYRSLEIFTKLTDVSKRVSRLPRELDVAVLVSRSRAQLSALIALKEYLEGVSVILVLPDMEKETVAMAHLLSPKYMEHDESDFYRVGAVLHKMSKRYHQDGVSDAAGGMTGQSPLTEYFNDCPAAILRILSNGILNNRFRAVCRNSEFN